MSDPIIASLIGLAGTAAILAGTVAVRASMRTQQHSDILDEHERRIRSVEVQAGETNRLLRDQHGLLQRILGRLDELKK